MRRFYLPPAGLPMRLGVREPSALASRKSSGLGSPRGTERVLERQTGTQRRLPRTVGQMQRQSVRAFRAYELLPHDTPSSSISFAHPGYTQSKKRLASAIRRAAVSDIPTTV